MIQILKDKYFKITVILTLVYCSIGFAFLHLGLLEYSWIIFVLLPITLGIAIGSMPYKKWLHYGVGFAFTIFILLLVLGKLEGMICVLMSVPIIIPLIFIGIEISNFLKKKGIFKPKNTLKVLALPIIILIFGVPIENFIFTNEAQIEEVKTTRIYPFKPEQVYNSIKSVDTLVADKPFLMKLDLPIPQKCILEREAIGGLRTCYFEGGTITEKITELEKGKILRMDVIDYSLTGRKWLGFNEAIYYFDLIGYDSCQLTRITTYSSTLKPRFYWKALEIIGINQEHTFVFDNLSNDLKKKYGR